MGVACLLASAHVFASCQIVSRSRKTKWLAGLSLSKRDREVEANKNLF